MVRAVDSGQAVSAVAAQFEVDRKTVRKWLCRYRAGGALASQDRRSRPNRFPTAIAKGTAQRVITLRRQRRTMATIAVTLRISRATVSRVLARAGLSRLRDLEPAVAPRRYERATPGELLHLESSACAPSAGRSLHYQIASSVRGALAGTLPTS
jgi:transposase-like protein